MRKPRSLTMGNQAGFTLVELMVTVAIILVLFGLSTINLGQAQTSVATATSVDTMLGDIRNAQLLAMVGEKGGTTTEEPHGLFVQSNKYTLFEGSSFNGSDSYNYVVNAGPNVSFSTTLPSGLLIFNKGDGGVSGFTAGSNTITVSTPSGSHVITINRYGVTTVN